MPQRERCIIEKLNEPIDALCTNKQRTMVGVAIKTGMKILSLIDNKFALAMDLRKRKPEKYWSLSWSPLKENTIASTLYNGTVLLWDLENCNSPYPYKAHRTQATKVCFSEFDENSLISGSKDGTVAFYDMRCHEPVKIFTNKEIPIRDLQFCMESKLKDVFAVADDSGNVRFWDIRNPNKIFKDFIAHTGYVNSISLNPQQHCKNLLATAGRDKFIKIWDFSKPCVEPIYFIEVMAPVTKVSWCPENDWHVASCQSSQGNSDHNIHVWDIRRPYLPHSTFNAHSDPVTDISFPRNAEDSSFLSCGKDGRLILHFMENGYFQLDYANSAAITSFSPFDGLVAAIPSVRNNSDPFRRKIPSIIFSVVPKDPHLMTAKIITYLAKNYKLVGGSVDELCKYNAQVAENVSLDQLAYSWRMIALLCAGTDLGSNRPQFSSSANGISGFKRISSQSHLDSRRDMERPLNGHGAVIGNSMCLDDDSLVDQALIGGTAATTTLISGSLSQGVQNALATGSEFFFGTNELNLFGMDGLDSNNNSNYLSTSRQSLLSYSDISKIKDEAFDFRSFRRCKTESTMAEEDDEEDDLEEGGEFFSDGEPISGASSFQAMTITGKLSNNIKFLYFFLTNNYV